MISNDQQGMSPTRAATLDGEINGPNYATVDGPPGMTGQNDDQNSGQVMNGIEPGPSSSSAIPPEATLPQHLGPAGLSNAADFLTATTSTKEPEGDARPLPPVPPGFSQDFAVPAGSATQHVGGFSFSPPEDFPAETRNADPASQTFWFAKIGEFVQRRVAQAGAAMTPILESRQSLRQVVTTPPRVQRLFTPEAEQAMSQWTRRAPHLFTPDQRAPQQEGSSNGSLTQEQVMAEVHKQVKLELRAHEEERQQLSDENQQLKAMLEKVLTQVQAQGLGGAGMGCGSGTSQGPQGGDHFGGCGGNPRELLSASSVPGSYPPVPKPGPAVRGHDGNARGCLQGDQQGPTVPGSDPRNERVTSNPAGQGTGGAEAVNGPGPLGGQRDQPAAGMPPKAGSGCSAGQLAGDPLGALVQGMAQLQAAMSQSLANKPKDVEVVSQDYLISVLTRRSTSVTGYMGYRTTWETSATRAANGGRRFLAACQGSMRPTSRPHICENWL